MHTLKSKLRAYFQACTILLICYISGCTSHLLIKSVFAQELTVGNTNLEILYNVEIRKNSILAAVKSTGCTSNKNFKLQLALDNKKVLNASIVRIKPDFCRAMPKVITIELFDEQLARNAKVIIKNDIANKDTF